MGGSPGAPRPLCERIATTLPKVVGSTFNDDATGPWTASGSYLYQPSASGTVDLRHRRFASSDIVLRATDFLEIARYVMSEHPTSFTEAANDWVIGASASISVAAPVCSALRAPPLPPLGWARRSGVLCLGSEFEERRGRTMRMTVRGSLCGLVVLVGEACGGNSPDITEPSGYGGKTTASGGKKGKGGAAQSAGAAQRAGSPNAGAGSEPGGAAGQGHGAASGTGAVGAFAGVSGVQAGNGGQAGAAMNQGGTSVANGGVSSECVVASDCKPPATPLGQCEELACNAG